MTEYFYVVLTKVDFQCSNAKIRPDAYTEVEAMPEVVVLPSVSTDPGSAAHQPLLLCPGTQPVHRKVKLAVNRSYECRRPTKLVVPSL